MKKYKRVLAVLFTAALVTGGCGKNDGSKEKSEVLDPDNPVTISVWNYYTGAQQESFDKLVSGFNKTKGKELGVIVEATNEGGVTDLENTVMASVNEEVGAKELPNIFATYTDTAFKVDEAGKLADLSPYLTEEEKEEYVESYIKEGEFSGDGSIKIFPVAKATEVFMLNKTDWDKFAEAQNVSLEALYTIEGITETAKKYYEWTDSLTDAPDDGKAFFGRDAVANYMIIGAKQLGIDMFESDGSGKVTLNFDKEVVRKLWDNYYVPFVNGYFNAAGRFRSDDIKTGNIISFVGSSSGATFFPDKVTLNDEESYPIETEVLPAPQFKVSEGYAVQQGAGMAVINSNEEEVTASVEFLKWMTDKEQNIEFSIDSGYLPVKKEANDKELIRKMSENSSEVSEVIDVAIDMVNENEMYTAPAYSGGRDARNILEYSMVDKAVSDRQTVIANIEGGMTHQEAAAGFETDDNFEQWYNTAKTELEKTIR